MHAPSLKKSVYRFAYESYHIEPHILLMTCIVLALMFILSHLNPPADYVSPAVSHEHDARSLHPVSLQANALTVFDDPHYRHEYGTRTRFIREQLVALMEATNADRVSLVVYGSGDSPLADANQTKTFEVAWEDGAPIFEVLYGRRQRGWPHMQDAYAYHYGIDVMNENGRIIGYLEAEYARDLSFLQDHEFDDVLRQTAWHVRVGLLGFLESLKAQENE